MNVLMICLSKHECVDDVKVITFVIWNPTINKVVELPSRPLCSIFGHYSYYGFGFDSKTGDYKVLCTHSTRRADFCTKNCDCSYEDANVVEIFDLRKGVWRGFSIGPLVHSGNLWGGAPECYLNGAVHWSGYRHARRIDMILFSFDMSDEFFREIRMPDDDGDNPVETRCVAFGGLVHVIVWSWECESADDYPDGYCSVWTMKEYGVTESWTKLFNIDLHDVKVYHHVEPYKFRLWENGQVLMVRDLSKDERMGFIQQKLVLYDTESRTCKQLFSFGKCISDMCLYEESLVLM